MGSGFRPRGLRLSLQLKLTVVFSLVAVIATAILSALSLASLMVGLPGVELLPASLVAGHLQQMAADLRPTLYDSIDQPAGQTALEQAMQEILERASEGSDGIRLVGPTSEYAIVTRDGRIIASAPGKEGVMVRVSIADELESVADAVMAKMDGAPVTVKDDSAGNLLVGAPLLDDAGEVVGALIYASTKAPTLTRFAQALAVVAKDSLLPVLGLALVIGPIAGFLTARGLVCRLRSVDLAAEAWGKGDFSVSVDDQSRDEIGRLASRLNAMSDEIRELLATKEKLAALEERTRISRELHDSVTQSLYGLALYSESAKKAMASGDTESALQDIEQLQAEALQALREMRLLIFELRPHEIGDGGLAAALQERLKAVEARSGVATSFGIEGVYRHLTPDVENGLFAVANEALNNVLKHANACSVCVRLRFAESSVTLDIDDDGVGFDPEKATGGIGLKSMRERAALLGGQVIVESPLSAESATATRRDARPHGTRVRVVI